MNKKIRSHDSRLKLFILNTPRLGDTLGAIGILVSVFVFMAGYVFGSQYSWALRLSFAMLLGFPLEMLMCVVFIVRQEVPRYRIKGRWAVIYNMFGLIVFGVMELVFLFVFLVELFSQKIF